MFKIKVSKGESYRCKQLHEEWIKGIKQQSESIVMVNKRGKFDRITPSSGNR